MLCVITENEEEILEMCDRYWDTVEILREFQQQEFFWGLTFTEMQVSTFLSNLYFYLIESPVDETSRNKQIELKAFLKIT